MVLFWYSKLCSSMESFHIEVEQLRSIFQRDNYPVNIIGQCVKKFLDKLYVPKQIVLTLPKKELLIFITFLGKFSMSLKNKFVQIYQQDIATVQCKNFSV